MQVQLWPEQSRLAGTLRAYYTNAESAPLSELAFRLYPNLSDRGGHLVVQKAARDGRPVEPKLSVQDTALLVPLLPPLAAGASTVVDLTFEVDIPTSSRAGYQEFVNRNGIIALAQFYPLIPARAGGEWKLDLGPSYGDVLVAEVALFRVSLTLPRTMIVAGTGVVTDQSDDLAAQTKTLKFVSGPAREFNLVVSPTFEVLSVQQGATLVRSFCPPEYRAGSERALRVAAASLAVYNDLFGVYPYTELDVAATTTTAGGIEYPGLIVLNESYYQGGRDDRFDWANAHEVAHQWWYGLVGNDQVNEPWLDEALAQYTTLLYYERTAGPQVAAQLREQVFAVPARQAQQSGRDQPIGLPVAGYDASNYGAIVYGKGPLFFQALRERMGDETFFALLWAYAHGFMYRMATGADFLALAEKISGQDLTALYAEWVTGP